LRKGALVCVGLFRTRELIVEVRQKDGQTDRHKQRERERGRKRARERRIEMETESYRGGWAESDVSDKLKYIQTCRHFSTPQKRVI